MARGPALAVEDVDLAAAEWEWRQAHPPGPSPFARDPAAWMAERLGAHLWSKQRDIAAAVAADRRVAVPSAHATGKSWLAARLVAWWLDVHPAADVFAVTTAPSHAQVRSVLWREIGAAHRAGNLPGHTNQTEWWIDGRLVAFGRKPSDYEPSAFQGIHARAVLVVLDEAAGIPEPLWLAAGSLAANEGSRILAIGNPDDRTSHFATVCAPGSGWTVLPVDGLETPNFTGEDVPDALRDLLLSRRYAEELAADVGEDSPVYRSKVRAEFPADNPEGVVPLSWVRACQRLDTEGWPDAPVELGVDVGAGGDETVIRERRGMVAGRTWRHRTPDWAEATGHVRRAIRETGASRVKVDTIGIGWGLAGALKETVEDHGAEIVPVNVAASASDPKRFPKLRDQLWWELGRELSRDRAWDLAALDETTVAQLIAPTWAPDSAGRHKVEPKEKTRARLRRSPDDADALLLAFYSPPARRPRLAV